MKNPIKNILRIVTNQLNWKKCPFLIKTWDCHHLFWSSCQNKPVVPSKSIKNPLSKYSINSISDIFQQISWDFTIIYTTNAFKCYAKYFTRYNFVINQRTYLKGLISTTVVDTSWICFTFHYLYIGLKQH